MNKKLFCLLLAGVALLLFSGCGVFKGLWEPEGEELQSPPQVLAYDGMEAMKKENYRTAAEIFQKLKDQYPYSKYAILAELKMADAYYLKDMFIEALAGYEDFEQLHPNNEAVPYAIYMQGMCNYKQMNTFMTDQMPTVRAIQAFYRLKQMYPESKFAAKGEARLAECKRNLAGHEFYVGEFYFKMDAYKAALGRFISLIRSYPDSGYHTRALEYIKLCRQKIAKTKVAGAEDIPEEEYAESPSDEPMEMSSETLDEALEKPELPGQGEAPLTGNDPQYE